MPTVRRIALIVRRVAALPSSQDLTGPPLGDEPCVLKGRCGGTDEFLGRGALFPQSPWSSVQGGRPLDKCLVQRHADAVWRKLPAAVSEAVKRTPVITTRKEDYSSLVRGAPVDRRGHIRVRLERGLTMTNDEHPPCAKECADRQQDCLAPVAKRVHQEILAHLLPEREDVRHHDDCQQDHANRQPE